jgi:hypothetical protein
MHNYAHGAGGLDEGAPARLPRLRTRVHGLVLVPSYSWLTVSIAKPCSSAHMQSASKDWRSE